MSFYKLNPEVAGGWGPKTKFVRTPGKRVVVNSLHYIFDGWLGDDLLESTPCFIVTERLAHEIRSRHLSGFTLRPVEVSTSEQFRDTHPEIDLPHFKWLDITGEAGIDDFGVADDGCLVVSHLALDAIRATQSTHCEVFSFPDAEKQGES